MSHFLFCCLYSYLVQVFVTISAFCGYYHLCNSRVKWGRGSKCLIKPTMNNHDIQVMKCFVMISDDDAEHRILTLKKRYIHRFKSSSIGIHTCFSSSSSSSSSSPCQFSVFLELPFYLHIARKRIGDVFRPLPRAFVQSKKLITSPRIWTQVAEVISYDGNRYAKSAFSKNDVKYIL